MSRIFFVWELGEGFGHLNRLLPVASALRDRGHEVVLAARHLPRADAAFGRRGFTVVPAPIWPGRPSRRLPMAVTYAEILLRFGFLHRDGLTAMVRAWRGLYEVVRPDLIVADHAPTALLAARDAGVPRALLATGFSAPPRVSPMPNMQPWKAVPEDRLTAAEAPVLETVNRVSEDLGLPPLTALSDLFDIEEVFLCTFAALDHYGPRPGARYWGPIFSSPNGAEPDWPDGSGPRLFVYLSGAYPRLDAVFEALRAAGRPTLAYLRECPRGRARALASETVRIVARPLDLGRVLETARGVISHGGHGAAASTLLAGRPLLVLPQNLEQRLLAHRTRRTGATLTPRSRKDPDLPALVRRLAEDDRLATAAQAFADAHREFDGAARIAAIADRCEALLGRPPAGHGHADRRAFARYFTQMK